MGKGRRERAAGIALISIQAVSLLFSSWARGVFRPNSFAKRLGKGGKGGVRRNSHTRQQSTPTPAYHLYLFHFGGARENSGVLQCGKYNYETI